MRLPERRIASTRKADCVYQKGGFEAKTSTRKADCVYQKGGFEAATGECLGLQDRKHSVAQHAGRVLTGYAELREWVEGWLEYFGDVFALARKRREEWDAERGLEEQGELREAVARLFEQAWEDLQQATREWERVPAAEDGRAMAMASARAKPLLSLRNHREGL